MCCDITVFIGMERWKYVLQWISIYHCFRSSISQYFFYRLVVISRVHIWLIPAATCVISYVVLLYLLELAIWTVPHKKWKLQFTLEAIYKLRLLKIVNFRPHSHAVHIKILARRNAKKTRFLPALWTSWN